MKYARERDYLAGVIDAILGSTVKGSVLEKELKRLQFLLLEKAPSEDKVEKCDHNAWSEHWSKGRLCCDNCNEPTHPTPKGLDKKV